MHYELSHNYKTSRMHHRLSVLQICSFTDWLIHLFFWHRRNQPRSIFWAAVVIEMDFGCHGYTAALTLVLYILSGWGVALHVSAWQQWALWETFFSNSCFFFVIAAMKRIEVSSSLCFSTLHFLLAITFVVFFWPALTTVCSYKVTAVGL